MLSVTYCAGVDTVLTGKSTHIQTLTTITTTLITKFKTMQRKLIDLTPLLVFPHQTSQSSQP